MGIHLYEIPHCFHLNWAKVCWMYSCVCRKTQAIQRKKGRGGHVPKSISSSPTDFLCVQTHAGGNQWKHLLKLNTSPSLNSSQTANLTPELSESKSTLTVSFKMPFFIHEDLTPISVIKGCSVLLTKLKKR